MFKSVCFVYIFAIFLSFNIINCELLTEFDESKKWPTVMFCVLARNKQHTLPYFLTLMNSLDYPKERIALSIHSDHNQDLTVEVLKTWFNKYEKEYHRVDLEIDEGNDVYIKGEKSATHWPTSRFEHVVTLRNNCLIKARNIWADYLFMLDADAFLTDNGTLKQLISKNFNIVAPMLKSDSLYSNFWCGMTPEYYYLRTDEYFPILDREQLGCFNVPMIHSAVLIDLRSTVSDKLSYDPNHLLGFNGPYDDIIAFAISANMSGESLYVCNEINFGYIMTPLEQEEKLDSDMTSNIVLQSIADDVQMIPDDIYNSFLHYPKPDKMAFDEIYMINLLRRPERRKKMVASFKELGIDAVLYDAVDGKKIGPDEIKKLGISFLPGYMDPHEERPMTAGEVGCFLSHYNIWKEMLDRNLEKVIILEDDVRFEPNFRRNVEWIMKEIQTNNIEWDLIYLGRKPMHRDQEAAAGRGLLFAGYSYWTLGYLININGARKLLDAKPLNNLVPVDEFLPIMFDKHVNLTWSSYYKKRDLVALSVNPLFIFPTHYTGQPGHISDTELSIQVNKLLVK